MRILIVEDEPAAAKRLTKMVKSISDDFKVIDQLETIEGFLNAYEEYDALDLILMDIHLADGSCFEIFEHIEVETPIIFITAYDQYAVEAFRVNAVDYLLKPVKKGRLKEAIDKFKKQQSQAEIDYKKLAEEFSKESPSKRFLIKIGQKYKLVDSSEIAYFFTKNKITFLNTFEGKKYPLDHSLEQLDQEMDSSQFFRINRQYIIHIDAIDKMHTYSKSRVKIELDPPMDDDIIVSTERSPHFKNWLVNEE